MGAVSYRLRSVLRRRWARTLAVTSIVAAVCSIVITIAAGAHRTATAPDRYTSASTLTADGIVTQEKGGRPQTNEVAALPGVAVIDGVTFVFGGIGARGPTNSAMCSCSPVPLGLSVRHSSAADWQPPTTSTNSSPRRASSTRLTHHSGTRSTSWHCRRTRPTETDSPASHRVPDSPPPSSAWSTDRETR